MLQGYQNDRVILELGRCISMSTRYGYALLTIRLTEPARTLLPLEAFQRGYRSPAVQMTIGYRITQSSYSSLFSWQTQVMGPRQSTHCWLSQMPLACDLQVEQVQISIEFNHRRFQNRLIKVKRRGATFLLWELSNLPIYRTWRLPSSEGLPAELANETP